MEANNNSAMSGKLVHIGAEVLVLVSVVFYLNGQLKNMKNEIRELRAKLEDQTEGTNKHLTKLYAMVDALQSRPTFPSHLLGPIHPGNPSDENWHHSGPRQMPHPGFHPRQVAPVPMELRQRRPKQANLYEQAASKAKASQQAENYRKPSNNPKRELKIAEEAEEPELPDEDELDEELKDELAEMEKLEALEENEENEGDEESEENSGNKNSKLSKDLEPPAQDLSFVQSAIRQTARKHQPIVKKSA